MKSVDEVVACVVDYGSFESLAEKLAETYAKVRYYTPSETEFREVKKCIIGTGLPSVVRCDDFMDPEVVAETDLWVFPDIGWGGTQRYLRSIGKAVWGSMGADQYELYRTEFIKLLEEIGLPVAPSKVVRGMGKLREHLRGVEDKWIKVNRFRANMETWHHIDYDHSKPMLDWMDHEFGGVSELIVFVVQEPIPHAQEVGYDGYTVDGQFPDKSFQGYEKKNELYLGSWLKAEEMPPQVTTVNEALTPVLERIGYKNFIASEIRDEFYIDPTMRMAGQTMEHQLQTCTNLPKILWRGANGDLENPEFSAKFAAEATIHYSPGTDNWMVLKVPEEAAPWVKLYYYCQDEDGTYHFPPHDSDELGVVLGNGDTVEAAIDDLKEHLELLESEPVHAHTGGFVDLIKEIKEAQAEGIKFSDKPLPTPASVIA